MTREVEARLKLSAVDKTATAFNAVSHRLKEVERQTKAFNRAQDAIARANVFEAKAQSIHRAETALLGYGKAMGGLALAGGAASAASAAFDFEAALSAIGKKGGYTAEVLAKIGAEAKALSTSGEVASPLSSILEGYERAAAAGIPIAEMKEFVLLTTKVGDAFEMSGEASANAFLGFNKTIGLAFDDMERYADLINSLADSGIADESGIVNFIDRAGASLKAYGLTAQQIAALGATSQNLKMGDDVAANALSTLTGKLLSPGSKEAQKALASIVGDVDAFQAILKTDANKALEVFLERVSKLDKFKQSKLLTSFIGDGFNDEVMRYAAALDEVRRNREMAEGSGWFGSLDRSYQDKLKLAQSQLQLFKNELGLLAIDVGTMGLPAMKEGLVSARSSVRELGEELKGFEAKIDMAEFEAAKEAVSALAETIGHLMGMGGEDTALGHFFDRTAAAADLIAGAVNITRDGLQGLGLAEADADTPEIRQQRRNNTLEAAGAISPPIEWLSDTWWPAFSRTFLGEGGAPPQMPETVSGRPSDDDLRSIGNRYASPDAGDGWHRGMPGELPAAPVMPSVPDHLPVPAPAAAPIAPLIASEPVWGRPSDDDLRSIGNRYASPDAGDGWHRGMPGELPAAPVMPSVPDHLPVPAPAAAPIAPLIASEPVWGRPSDDDLRSIGNRYASPDDGGWQDGLPAARPAPYVPSAPEALPPLSADLDPDALRRAIEDGGRSLTTAGDAAGLSLQDGTVGFASDIRQAAADLRAAGSSIAADIRSALAAGVKVNMPAPPAPLPRADRAPARTMSGAGTPGGGW